MNYYEPQCHRPLPIRLSQISSRLRRIVLNTPLLWTNLDNKVFRSPAILDCFLQRSQNCGLEIDIHDVSSSKEYLDEVLRNFGKVVVCVNRWHSLDIHINFQEHLHMFIAHVHDLCAPNLNRISIFFIPLGEFRDEALATTIFTGGTPALKSLCLSGVACFPNSLETLTSLCLRTYPWLFPLLLYTHFREQLIAMRSLVHLRCVGPITHCPSMQAIKAVNLPSLRSLTIDVLMDNEAPPPHFVSGLCCTLPTTTLQHISLTALTDQMVLSFLHYMRNGTLRFPHVKSLTWSSKLTDEKDIITIMESFAEVEDLTIPSNFTDTSESLLQVLLQHDRDSPTKCLLWPHLHTLRLKLPWRIILLHDFVVIRLATDSPIRKVWTFDSILAETKEVKWLQEYAGLESLQCDWD